MQWLVLIHVLSAILGVGPTFFGHVLMRRSQSLAELRQSLALGKKLEYFPKIGGTIALLSGFALVIFGNYGSFMQVWMVGALVLYLYIQIVVIAFVAPRTKKLAEWAFDGANVHADVLPAPQSQLFHSANSAYWAASIGGVLLFVLMIMKPAFIV